MSVVLGSHGNRFMISIEDECITALIALCRGSLPVETGGILTGFYTEDGSTAIIRRAYPPPDDSVATRNTFVRGSDGVKELLEQIWQGEHREYYIGGWHSHPDTPPMPSPRDVAQMRSFASSEKVDCTYPILILVSGCHESHIELTGWVCSGDERLIPLV